MSGEGRNGRGERGDERLGRGAHGWEGRAGGLTRDCAGHSADRSSRQEADKRAASKLTVEAPHGSATQATRARARRL